MPVGSSATYKLPAAEDPDGEEVLTTVILGKAQNFTKFNAGLFSFRPAIGDEGTYNITIILIDRNRKPLSASYSFLLTVS